MKLIQQYQRGLSLIELMVALVIGLFLSIGIYAMFLTSASSVTTTGQYNQMQENGRIALAIIVQDVTQLGFMADMTGIGLNFGTNVHVDVPSLTSDCVGAGFNNATFPMDQPSNFRLLWGYEQGASVESLGCLSGTNVRNHTDVLQLKRLIGPETTVPNGATKFYVGTTSNQMIFFSGSQPAPTLTNVRFWEYQQHIYFIGNEGSIPVLKRRTLSVSNGMSNTDQLVEGIEDIRILYGIDGVPDNSVPDGVPDSYVPAAGVSSAIWDGQLSRRIIALKIYVLVRAVDVDNSYTNDIQYRLGDKTISAQNDHYRRKVMSTTIVLKNPQFLASK